MDETLEYEVKKYEKYKRDVKYLLGSSGVWPNFPSHPRYLRNFLYYCSVFASGSTFWGIAMFFKKYVRNINTLTRGLGLLIAFFSTFIKIIILRKYEKDLKNLNKGVSAKFEEDLKDPESRKHLLVHLPTFSRCFYVYVLLGPALGALYVRKHTDRQIKVTSLDLIRRIRESLKTIIEKLGWMDAKTKSIGLEKLSEMALFVFYPDEFLDNEKLDN